LHAIGRRFAAFFAKYDILLSPVASQPPEPLGTTDMMSDDAEAFVDHLFHLLCFTRQFNVTGAPAAAIPLHWTPEGLPVGVQFAADFGNEALLFRLAAQLEQAKPWRERRPAAIGQSVAITLEHRFSKGDRNKPTWGQE
jgi:amidase